jgi:predicted Zn finger-like uncharacterized protein
MGRKRPDRTARRAEQRMQERVARGLVRDREKLAALVAGGSAERPIEVTSAAVIETRVRSLACPQCEGEYTVDDHRSTGAGMRALDVKCRLCGVERTLWFRIVSDEPN